MVATRSSQGRTGGGFRSAGLVAVIKLSAILSVCYLWNSDKQPDSKYYIGAIVALAIPIPIRRKK